MTKEILRFHSPQNCEVYRLRGGTLRHVASGALADLDTARVTDCILGPDQFLWSQVDLDADGFTPDADTFLFASATILPVDQIAFLPPNYNDQTQEWTQIWSFVKNWRICLMQSPVCRLCGRNAMPSCRRGVSHRT